MKPPRWSFVAIFFAFLSLAAAQQEQVWPVLANGPALAVDPVTQRVMVTNTAGGCCTINAVQTFDFAALGYSVSGSLSGDLGNIGPNSVLSFSCTTSPPNLVAYTAWTPGVHIVTTSLSPCDGGDAGIVYSGSLQIIVPPVSPAPAGPGCSPTLVDPVNSIPNLLDGNAITTDQRRLAGSSNFTVTGVSADGVTEALVTIPANHVGDNIQISVINDAGSPSSSSAQDGGLMPIGGSSTSLSGTQYLVASDPLNTGQPVAFAIYVAPVNYARGTQDFPQDNKSIQRQVSFQVFCPGSSGSIGSPTNTPVRIARPPVVLVHGLWSNGVDAWANFTPLNSQNLELWGNTGVQQPAFTIAKFEVDYSAPVVVTSTTPSYATLQSGSGVSGNNLGFSYNAPQVLSQIVGFIGTYAPGSGVAGVQADVVAHSLGGDIVRAMTTIVPPAALPFSGQDNYGQGPVHKLITIGTPHLGTPLAALLLPTNTGDPNHCVRSTLGDAKDEYSFQSVEIGTSSFNGAVGDFTIAPNNLPATSPFPTAYLAGSVSQSINMSGVGSTADGNAIYYVCGGILGNPLGAWLTPTLWGPNVFGTNSIGAALANDAVVPVTSALNGVASTAANTLPGVIHSAALEALGFGSPSELDPGSGIPDAVVNLLNEAPNGSDFH